MKDLNTKPFFNSEIVKAELNNFLSLFEQFLSFIKQIEISLPSFVSKANYISISILEKLGILSPSQEQIDMVEVLVLLTTDVFQESTNTLER